MNGIFLSACLLPFLFFVPGAALAHCDGMDGPVVIAAQKALEADDVNLVLPWVQAQDEAEVRSVFAKTRAVRKLSPEAEELADRYFFEAVVRIHRAGEAEPYTGLKPAGRDLGPAMPAVDQAIRTESASGLLQLLTGEMLSGVNRRFREVLTRKRYAKDDVRSGREYVKSYVDFIHYVEGVHRASVGGGHKHEHE